MKVMNAAFAHESLCTTTIQKYEYIRIIQMYVKTALCNI